MDWKKIYDRGWIGISGTDPCKKILANPLPNFGEFFGLRGIPKKSTMFDSVCLKIPRVLLNIYNPADNFTPKFLVVKRDSRTFLTNVLEFIWINFGGLVKNLLGFLAGFGGFIGVIKGLAVLS